MWILDFIMNYLQYLGTIFEEKFRPLIGFFTKTHGYILSWQYYRQALQDEMNELKSIRDDVVKKVGVAERRRMEPTNEVKLWLDRVAALEEQVAKINHEFRERLTASQNWWQNKKSTYQLSKKADEMVIEAQNLKQKGVFNKVADELVQVRFEEIPSTPVFGMDSFLGQLRDSLSSDNIGVVGIYGMGGVGKTALLKKFNNEILAKAKDIDFVIYIEVSNDLNMDEIQRVIGDRLGLLRDKKTPKERALEMYQVLSKMNFVLILDDLWDPLDLLSLGVPIPKRQSKSKIVLATRIEDVCDRMDVKKKIKVECLPWAEAWDLFQEKVGEALVDSDSRIRRHAQELVAKCGGLPLALITVGRAMASKRTAKEWKHAIAVLEIAPWQLLGMETDVFNHLKRSYDNLPNDKLRTCLLYCYLFPEESSIHKNWITDYCIGEGLIDGLYVKLDEIYNMGHHLLGVLKTASLLERGDSEDHVKMHPMVRAMALCIASEFGAKKRKWIVQAGVRLKEAPRAEKWAEAEMISLMKNDINGLYEAPNCPNMRTLMVQDNYKLATICDGFFRYMPSLRVLDISHTLIIGLPSAIGSLASLQYLDFSKTQISSLPEELKFLVKLRFLFLSVTPLTTIPNGVIGSLLALEVLYMERSYGDWKIDSTGTGVEFQELECLRRLKALDITIQTGAALHKLTESHQLARSTRRLHLEDYSELVTIQFPSDNLWKKTSGLRRVSIANCGNLKDVIIKGGNEDDLPNLQEVTLQGLPRARIIWNGSCLHHLTHLEISVCNIIEQLIEIFSEGRGGGVGEGEEEECRTITAFPNLKWLHLDRLPNFRSLSSGRTFSALPSLEILKVVDCSKLTKLKLTAEKLKEIVGTNKWWDILEWDDDHHKSTFLPLFKHL